ncbi:hypothetical protein F4X88_21740 [Candidatus Poribacteria bacterium]|nr:hypothetical protein [Candidatus Poribacteria bacterium]MYA58906.1 hypothetical protein [Candidatus Poribacteria bacterium]
MQRTELSTPFQISHHDGRATDLALPNGAIARLGRGPVHDIAFLSGSSLFVVGTRIGIWLYELPTMSPIGLWDTERGLVSSVAFSPDGRFLAAGNWDGDIKIWDVQDIKAWKQISGFKFDSQVSQVIFSPNQQYLAVSGKNRVVHIWHLETGTKTLRFGRETEKKPGTFLPMNPLCLSSDNKLLAYASPDNTILIWSMEDKERISCFTEQTSSVYALSFSPCGRFIASGSRDGLLNVWDVAKGTRTIESNYGKSKIYPSYSLDGTLHAAEIRDNIVVIWDAFRSKKLDTFEYCGPIITAQFSNGKQLAISSPIELKVWSAKDASISSVFQEHTSSPASVVFSPDSQTLAAGYWINNGAILWDIECKRARMTFADGQPTLIHSLDFSHSGDMLAAGCHDTNVKIWDVKESELITELTAHQKPVRVVAFGPKGHLLVSADTAGNIYMWDVQRSRKLKDFTGHRDCIKSVAFGPQGKLLVSASDDSTARLWNVKNGTEIAKLPIRPLLDATKYKGKISEIEQSVESFNAMFKASKLPSGRIETIAFSPCGEMIAGGLYREIRLWDAFNCEICMTILQPQGCRYPFALTFSPCGQYLASGAWWQGTAKVSIRLWEVASGENIVTFWGHATDVQSLAFSSDGRLLASSGFDGVIYLWDMTPYL